MGELFTLESISSLAGAALAVAVVVALLKPLFGLTGRLTQAVTLTISLILSITISTQTGQPILLAILNGFVIASVAAGTDQYVNYDRKE